MKKSPRRFRPVWRRPPGVPGRKGLWLRFLRAFPQGYSRPAPAATPRQVARHPFCPAAAVRPWLLFILHGSPACRDAGFSAVRAGNQRPKRPRIRSPAPRMSSCRCGSVPLFEVLPCKMAGSLLAASRAKRGSAEYEILSNGPRMINGMVMPSVSTLTVASRCWRGRFMAARPRALRPCALALNGLTSISPLRAVKGAFVLNFF